MNRRTKRQTKERQGSLTTNESQLSIRMMGSPNRYFSTLDICKILGCVSARDRVRKMKANGCPIGPAKFLHETESGARIYGYRVAK